MATILKIRLIVVHRNSNLCYFFVFQGLAITFVSDETDARVLNEVQDRFEVDISELPDEIDLSTYIEGRWKKNTKRRESPPPLLCISY